MIVSIPYESGKSGHKGNEMVVVFRHFVSIPYESGKSGHISETSAGHPTLARINPL